MNKLIWIKWRHKFADGSDNDFKYERLYESDLKDFFSEKREAYDWSDHYRGTEHEVIYLPPKEILINLCREMENKANVYAELAKEYKSMLEEL